MIEVKVKTTFNPRFLEEFRDAIISTLDRISSRAQEVAVKNAPADIGQLRNSISVIRNFEPPSFEGGIQTNLPHAIVQEFGRRPGKFPPEFPIARWITRKRAVFGAAIKEFGGGAKGLRRITFLVRRKIAKKGFPGKFFFKKAEEAIRREFPNELARLGASIQTSWEKGD